MERIHIERGGEAEVEVELHLLEVDGPSGSAAAIHLEHLRGHPQLLREIRHGHCRCGGQVIRGKSEIPQGTELEGKPQPCMGLAVLVNGLLIRVG